MNSYKNNFFPFRYFVKFQDTTIKKLAWPYSTENNGLIRWRALVLFSILFTGLILGTFAFIAASLAIAQKGAWVLAIADMCGLLIGLMLFTVHRIKFETRALITCLLFYFTGMAVIVSVGPQIGGPAWLFAFSVLAGVLMGSRAAFGALFMNALFLVVFGLLILKGKLVYNFPFFNSPNDMIAAGGNFILVNAITAISVSALVKGVYKIYQEKDELARHLEKEREQLIQTQLSLESEIKDRNQAQNALKKSEELFKLITGHTSALVSIHDSNTNYIFASPSHERLGYNPEDLIGQSGFTMMEEQDISMLLERLENAKNGKLSKAFIDYRLKDKKGKIHNFRGAFDAVFKSNGSLEKIICVGEDITKLRQAEKEKINALAQVAEAKKLALVGQIAGKMAHDFNNILGVIMGTSELSLMECSDKNIRKNLELIFNQTLRGKNLTKNLVAFAKSQEPKHEFFKINEIIDLALNLMEKDLEQIELIVDHGRGMPDLLADAGMIEHSLINLLQNSIHALSKAQHPKIFIKTYCLDEYIYFEIKDNGCGIPKIHLENIYDPSFTLKGSKDVNRAYEADIKGTGYGMANIKKYIEQHNGKIWVESAVNSGTKFTISLPVIKKGLTHEEKEEIQNETTHFKKNILLVEDEPAISAVQQKILTQDPCSHKVDIADCGQAAMDLFHKNQYDFISLDYILPGNFNGMDVYNNIRETNKNIPILFISGNIEFLESIKNLKQKDSHVDHLSKPCRNIDYITGINNLMNRSLL